MKELNKKVKKLEERKKLLERELNRLVELIIKFYDPEKIILFGSFAEGNIHSWSDLDLLIIKHTTKRPIERIMELSKILKPKVGIDLFIYTPEEFETLLKENYKFIIQINQKGKILYEKRN